MITSDHEIELSDSEDDFPLSRNSTYSFESNMNALRQVVLQYPVKSYFSTDQSLLELEINTDYRDSLSNMVSNVMSNERSFGPRELFLEDFNRLNGTNWANDKVIDAMFDVVQRKCLSLGEPVIAIPVAWYYFLTVSYFTYLPKRNERFFSLLIRNEALLPLRLVQILLLIYSPSICSMCTM